jgi:hypothetical protein
MSEPCSLSSPPSPTRLAEHRFGAAVVAVAVCCMYLLFGLGHRTQRAEGDGVYNWIFARSLAFDGDIHFANDYKLCGDPWHVGRLRGTDHPDNTFYAGPSLVWVPLLLAARVALPLSPSASLAARQGCSGPYVTAVLGFTPLLAGLALFLCYLSARRFAGDGAAAAATALIGLGSPLAAYAGVFPSYAHCYSAVAAALMTWLTLRARERPDSWGRWLAAAGSLAVLTLMRPTDAVMALFPAAVAATTLRRRWPRLIAVLAILVTGVGLGALPTLLVYKYLYGTYLAIPQGRYYLDLRQAHPWLLLFAPHGGLFYYTPGVWISLAGAWVMARQRWCRPLLAATLVASALVIWVAASPLDWHAAGTFGARRLVVLVPWLVLLAAPVLQRLGEWLTPRPMVALAAAATLALSIPVGGALGAQYAQARLQLPTERAHTQGEIYGLGGKAVWDTVDEALGPLAIAPAALYFRLRYGLSPRMLAAATEGDWYTRNFLTLAWKSRSLPVQSPVMAQLATGMLPAPAGLRMGQERSTLVFSAQWRWATHVIVKVSALGPTTMRVGAGRVWGTKWFGQALPVKTTLESLEFPIPEGGFGSGVNELVFEIDNAWAGVVISGLELDDRTPRGPAF